MRDGWTETTLGEAATLIMGQSPPGSSYNDRGEGLPFLQGSAEFGSRHPVPVKWCSEPRRVAQPGDVLVSVRAPVGDLNVAETETAIGRGLAIVRGGPYALTDFLMLAIEAGVDELLARSGAGMFTSITKDGLASLPIVLPSLVVQRRVVDLVDAVDTYAAAAKTLASWSESLIAALESAVMASSEHQRALGEVTQFAGGYAFSPDRQGNNEGDLPFYKVSDMNAPENQHTMTVAANYVSDEVLSEMRAKAWPAGTVVFPKVGAALLTEKRRLLGTRAAFDNNVMGLVPLPDIRPDYLLSYMRTVRLGDYAQPGAVPSVNQSHLRDLMIPMPSLEDQDEFISTVSAIRSTLEAAVAEADALSRLRSALLGELLSGEREIPGSYDELVGLVA